MQIKKVPSADLQTYKSLFFFSGLIVALIICLIIFNWKTKLKIDTDITNTPQVIMEAEEIEVTRQEEPKPEIQPPQAPKVISTINIVNHEVDLDKTMDAFDSEFDDDIAVDLYEYDEGAGEEEVDEETIFVVAEEMPTFRGGGLDKFREYVRENTRYPEAAAEIGIQGRVQISFVVERDGSVKNVKVLRGVDPLLDKEAKRVVEASPKWTPGKQRGKPVRIQYNIPVVFFLHS